MVKKQISSKTLKKQMAELYEVLKYVPDQRAQGIEDRLLAAERKAKMFQKATSAMLEGLETTIDRVYAAIAENENISGSVSYSAFKKIRDVQQEFRKEPREVTREAS